MKIAVILLAGGKGTRMQSEIPKQFLSLKNLPVAQYSLNVFSAMSEISEIVFVSEPEYRHHIQGNVKFALPGPRRQDSVYNGFQAVSKDVRLVLVHDAARPFINRDMVKRLIEATIEHGAAVTAKKVRYTVKEGDDFVENTLDRERIWEIQTPQGLRYDILKEGFEMVNIIHHTVTDDGALAEIAGYNPKLVEGDYANFKITTPDDLIMAQYFVDRYAQS